MGSRARILIVDDEPKNLQLLSSVFCDEYDISVATSGAEALKVLEIGTDIELILLDVMMPVMDGYAVYEKLQADPDMAPIPVIFVTARTDADSEITGLSAGAVDYIHKPIQVGVARARVRNQITAARQRKELETLLRERTREQRRLSNTLEGTRAGTWEWEIDSDRLIVNSHFAQMLGYRLDELEPFTVARWEKMYHPEDFSKVFDAIQTHIQEPRQPYSAILRARHKLGHWVWLQSRGSIIDFDEQGRPLRMFGTHADISGLAETREMAEQANRAKTEFLAAMSHEIRTPLSAMLGFCQTVAIDEALPPEHVASLAEVRKAGEHVLGLVNELLDLSKIESNRFEFFFDAVSVDEIVRECMSLTQAHAALQQVTVSSSGPTGLFVHADRLRFKQVLLNLMSNAIKFNEPGGAVELTVAAEPLGATRIEVRDTGIGIDAEMQDKLFTAFGRGEKARARAIEGVGLGLSITRRLVERMGGAIGHRHGEDRGSVFWFMLPPAHADLQAAAQARSEATPKAASPLPPTAQHLQGQHTVLCIDDNPANLRLLQIILRKIEGVVAHVTTSPMESLNLALQHKPDLILMDIEMPQTDGYALLKMMREHGRLQHTPILALSANAMPEDVRRGLTAGFVRYLTKPFDVLELMGTVRELLMEQPAARPSKATAG